MRCEKCEYLVYDYSEGYEDCMFSIPDEDCTEYNGLYGCKYTQKQLDKMNEQLCARFNPVTDLILFRRVLND